MTPSPPASAGLRYVPDLLLAVARRFYADQCLVRASALAYTSLLSLVPLLAVMFAVLKGLGVQERLEGVLLSRLSLDASTTDMIIGYIDRTNFATLGALGATMLLLTVISVLGTIEASFNLIWRVARPRTLWRQVTDYLSVVLLTPFLLLAGVAITSAGQVQQLLQWVTTNGYLGGAAMAALQLSPIAINAVAIGILYAVMPNRRPALVPIVISALAAGTAWHLVQVAYLALQVGVANNNAIYGALAQLPVTLVWLYVSWTIVLGGAELAAVLEFGTSRATGSGHLRREAVALHILVRAADAFTAGAPGVEALALTRELRVDPQDAEAVLAHLQKLNWISSAEGHPHRFLLARDPTGIDLAGVAELADTGAVPERLDPRVRAWLSSVDVLAGGTWTSWRLTDVLAGDERAAAEPKRDTTQRR